MGDIGLPSAELRPIARQRGSAVRSTNARISGLAGGVFNRACRLPGYRVGVRLRANDEWLVVEVERETSLCFAGRAPDRIVGADRPFGNFGGVSIFTPAWFGRVDQLERWLTSYAVRLGGLVRDDDEQFLISKNRSMFALKPRGVDPDLERLDALVQIVEKLPPAEAGDAPPIELPDTLDPLLPLIETWAVSDDEARAEMIERTSSEQLEMLVHSVTPYLHEINRYFDARGHAAGALVFGDLAQTAIEAQNELERRQEATRG